LWVRARDISALERSRTDVANGVGLGSALGMAIPGVVNGLFGTPLVSWLIGGYVRAVNFDSPSTYVVVAVLQLTIALDRGRHSWPTRLARRTACRPANRLS
jgi:hypothetical protein